MVFSQNFGAAVVLVIAQTILINSLSSTIQTYAPLVNPDLVTSSGSTMYRSIIPTESIGGVLFASAKSLDNVFYFCAGFGLPAIILGWFMGWIDLRKLHEHKENDSGSASEATVVAV